MKRGNVNYFAKKKIEHEDQPLTKLDRYTNKCVENMLTPKRDFFFGNSTKFLSKCLSDRNIFKIKIRGSIDSDDEFWKNNICNHVYKKFYPFDKKMGNHVQAGKDLKLKADIREREMDAVFGKINGLLDSVLS